jgi:hypothetical protein
LNLQLEESEIAAERKIQELELDKKQLSTKIKHLSMEKNKLQDELLQSQTSDQELTRVKKALNQSERDKDSSLSQLQ